jgi:hypothetical protein
MSTLFAFEPSPNRKIDPTRWPNVKPWVRKAIDEEDQKPKTQLWDEEPDWENQRLDWVRQLKFLRKYGKTSPPLIAIADRLESCTRQRRCCSGACPQCRWLFQRWFVRKSKYFIDRIDDADQELVAITIVPARPLVKPGRLNTLSIINFRRRLAFALDKVGLGPAVIGIDFSYNEDRDGKYAPFWCVHFYIIASVENGDRVTELLKEIYKPNGRIPRPVKISKFDNSARRRSYALKTQFIRRIGYDEVKLNGRLCRNTSRDKLRVAERLELFEYLDQCELAQRFVFRGCKPIIKKTKVTIRTARAVSYQGKSKKVRKMAKKHQKKGSFAQT